MKRKPRGLQSEAYLVTRVYRPFLRLLVTTGLFRVSVRGLDNVPKEGAAIIACNHLSLADPVVVWGSMRRNLIAVAAQGLWRVPFLSTCMRTLDHIPIKRGNAKSGAKTRKRMEKVVKAGGLLLIFPEGRCSPDGTLLELKPGATDIAYQTNTPIIPAGIAGSNAVWPLGSNRLHRKEHVVLVYGKSVHPGKFASAEEMRVALTQRIQMLMAEAESLRAI